MAELKCPHCGQAFTVDDTEVSSIIQQIRDKEFQKDLKSRVSEMEEHMRENMNLSLKQKKMRLRQRIARHMKKRLRNCRSD